MQAQDYEYSTRLRTTPSAAALMQGSSLVIFFAVVAREKDANPPYYACVGPSASASVPLCRLSSAPVAVSPVVAPVVPFSSLLLAVHSTGHMNLASYLQLRHAGRGAVSSLRRPGIVLPLGATSSCPELLGASETHQHRFSSSSQVSEPAAKEKKGGYFGWLREVFSEEKIKERKESLKDELKRGYVNDFKELRANQGKVFAASDSLWGSEASKPFPALPFVNREDKPAQVPVVAADDGSVKATPGLYRLPQRRRGDAAFVERPFQVPICRRQQHPGV